MEKISETELIRDIEYFETAMKNNQEGIFVEIEPYLAVLLELKQLRAERQNKTTNNDAVIFLGSRFC